VLVPETIFNAYNDAIAPANGLPRLSKSAITGMRFNLIFGRSSLRNLDDSEIVEGVVVGVTDKLDALGLIIPIDVVKHFNRKFGSNTGYLYAFVEAEDHDSFSKIVKQIDDMGFVTETEKSLSDHILTLKKNTRLLIDGLMYLIIFISVVAISFSTVIAVINRVEYYRIMRMVGASKVFISVTVLIKYLILGFVSAYSALAIINFTSGLVDNLPMIAGLQINFSLPSDFSTRMLVACTVLPVLSCIPALIKLYVKALNVD
jgi:ABC-type lipoprotein release transport system permease subunit